MTSTGNVEKISMSLEEVARLKRHFFGERAFIDRVSLALVSRLLTDKRAQQDTVQILHEIECLEGLRPGSRTKRARRFRPPLQRFWHKHFFSARHLVKNIGDHWGLSRRDADVQGAELQPLIEEVAKSHGHLPDRWPGILAHRMWIEGLDARGNASKLTGDWMVFGKHEGKNYYLELATHHEGEKHNADKLFEKLRLGCAAEFPFIFE